MTTASKANAVQVAAELTEILLGYFVFDAHRTWYWRRLDEEHGLAWHHWAPDVGALRLREVVHGELKRMMDADPPEVLASVTTATVVAELQLLLPGPVAGFDRNPEFMRLIGGYLVDLRTGETRPARPHDFIVRHMSVEFPSFDPPTRWLSVLARAMPGAGEVAYFQQFAGYAFTGYTREHLFAFLQGPGGGGKSLILDVLRRLAGSYHVGVPDHVFVSNHPQHRQWLARLDGARLVCIAELPSGAWRTGPLKSLVSGDVQTANFMRMESFDFTPAATVVIGGNTKPRIPDAYSGFARRLLLIPVESAPEKERDPLLPEKLWRERNEIAGWMIEGARQYLESGLGAIPTRWRDEARDYITSEDMLRSWLDLCLVLEPSAFTPNRRLTESAEAFTGRRVRITALKEWAHSEGLPVTFTRRRPEPGTHPVAGALGIGICVGVPDVPDVPGFPG